MRLIKLSKILLFGALLYTRPFDLGQRLLGLERSGEFFGLVFRLADLGLFVAVASLLPAIWDKLRARDLNLKQDLILSLLGLSLSLYWIYSNLPSLQSFKTGIGTIFSLIVSLVLSYKYNPKWLLILIPYFCFDHILVSSPVAASILLLLGLFSRDLAALKPVKKWEAVALLLILSVNLGLAIYQVAAGRSFGLSWLGEPNLSVNLIGGAAKQILPITGQIVLRGYGLMPHPNILGFLGVFGFLVSTSGFRLGKISKTKPLFEMVSIWLSLALIAVSMSRMAVIALLLSGILSLTLKYQSTAKMLNFKNYFLELRLDLKIFAACLPVLLLILLIFSLATRSSSDVYRLKQHQTLFTFIQNKPTALIFGVGPGQYPNQLRATQITQNSWENEPFYQPFGNLLVELGLLGLVLSVIIASKLVEIL